MAISRAQLAKELEPGLNALFGMEYARYENQHTEIFTTESSDRAFEEEVMLSGFGAAPTNTSSRGWEAQFPQQVRPHPRAVAAEVFAKATASFVSPVGDAST